MKNKPGTAWKLGMFVTIGFLIFLVAIYYIGRQQNLFGSTFRMKTVFSSVSGLKVGNNVRFSGIDVGTVDNIQILSDTAVLVEMVLDKEVQKFIKNDARASVGSEGLMGDKVVVINSGASGPPVTDNSQLASDPPAETDQIMANILITTENAAIITDQLAEITWKINNGEGALSKLLMDSTIGENLSMTLSNLKESSKNLNQNMEAAKHSFLLKGYFKKKQKQQEEKQKDQKEKKEEKEQEQKDKK